MIELFRAAQEIADFFKSQRWDYVFIGGLAVMRWGELRTTIDVDVTLLTRYQHEEECIVKILTQFTSRISDAKSFAIQHRVLLLKAKNGVAIDLTLAGLPFEEHMSERSSLYPFTEEYVIRTCSAEDLIVLKAFANREKDWLDIESIIICQKENLDYDTILSELIPLCEAKENLEIVDRLKKLIRKQKET